MLTKTSKFKAFTNKQFIHNLQLYIMNLKQCMNFSMLKPCRVGLVVSVSASHTVGREFASRLGHTKDHHKNGTNCLLACHVMR